MSAIASTKLIGIGCVGALAVTSGLHAPHALAALIHRLDSSVGIDQSAIATNVAVASTPVLTGVLAALASAAFYVSYAASAPADRHPYLVYAALGAPAAAAAQYYLCGPWLRKANVVDVVPDPAPTPDDLGQSYIHVGSDSSASTPASPAIDREVDASLAKKEKVAALQHLRSGYRVSGAIAAAVTLVSLVGVVGDWLL